MADNSAIELDENRGKRFVYAVTGLAKRVGATPIKDTLWRYAFDDWRLVVNGFMDIVPEGEGHPEMQPTDCYVEWKGWPGMIFTLGNGEAVFLTDATGERNLLDECTEAIEAHAKPAKEADRGR